MACAPKISAPVTSENRDAQLCLLLGLWIPLLTSEVQIPGNSPSPLALIASVVFGFERFCFDVIPNVQKRCAVIKSHPHPFFWTFPCMHNIHMLASVLLLGLWASLKLLGSLGPLKSVGSTCPDGLREPPAPAKSLDSSCLCIPDS